MSSEEDLRFLCTDPDPRVRAGAIRKLEQLCMRHRGILSMDSYLTVRDLCSNSSVNVRLSALKILEQLAQNYPEFLIKNQRGHEVRLYDDAFSIMCHAINDLETSVRTEAVTLLGRFRLVSDSFLHQTLDKKLLAPMKVQKDGSSNQSTSSGWSTGKKFGEAAPDIPDDDDESLAILPTNTCGAFVTALEDEFMDVRLPAVLSLCDLATNRPDFVFAAIDHVSDMFNDEMHEVRLASIRALSPLLTLVKLNEAQLDSILSVLSDATPSTRIALHELLADSNPADSACIRLILKELMISMQRFPRDKESIYRCLSKIGRSHSFLIHALVPELFLIHPIFEPQEQDLNDDFYLAHLILGLNAAAVQAPIRPLIPKYAIKHYRFVRHAMPSVIPVIEGFERRLPTNSLSIRQFMGKDKNFNINEMIAEQVERKPSIQTDENGSIQNSDKHLDFIYQQILNAYSNPISTEKIMFLKMILKDLSVSENVVDEQIVAPVRLLKSLCQLIISYDMCVRRQYKNETAVLNVIEECLQLITHVRYLFNNVHRKVLVFLAECEFHLKIEYLFLKLETDKTLTDAIMLEQISEEIQQARRQYERLEVRCSEQTVNLTSWVSEFVETHVQRAQRLQTKTKAEGRKYSTSTISLLSSETSNAMRKLGECQLLVPPELPNLRKCNIRSIRLIELNDSQEQPINLGRPGADPIHRFVAGLPTALRLHAHLFNMAEDKIPSFRVEILYPDDLRDYQKPESSQLVRMSNRLYQLDMLLIITAEHWAEPSEIQIRCGLLTDKWEEDQNMEDNGSNLMEKTTTKFVPLLDADNLSQPNSLQLKIHPMIKC